MNCNNKKSI